MCVCMHVDICVYSYCLLSDIFYGILKVLFVEMFVSVVFVMGCLYSAVSLTWVRG